MTTHNPNDSVVAALEKEQERLIGMVMSGACPDYVSYREMVASYKAIEMCIDTASKVFEGDDDEGD